MWPADDRNRNVDVIIIVIVILIVTVVECVAWNVVDNTHSANCEKIYGFTIAITWQLPGALYTQLRQTAESLQGARTADATRSAHGSSEFKIKTTAEHPTAGGADRRRLVNASHLA